MALEMAVVEMIKDGEYVMQKQGMKIIKVNMREKTETPKTLLKYNFVPGKVVQFFWRLKNFMSIFQQIFAIYYISI